MATAHAGARLWLLTVANPTANAVTDTVKKNFGNLVIAVSVSVLSSTFSFVSVRRFQERQNLPVFLGGQTHVVESHIG